METKPPIVHVNYCLICEVDPPSSLAVTSPSYQWEKNKNNIGDTNRELHINYLELSENGTSYKCQYTASSILY